MLHFFPVLRGLPTAQSSNNQCTFSLPAHPRLSISAVLFIALLQVFLHPGVVMCTKQNSPIPIGLVGVLFWKENKRSASGDG